METLLEYMRAILMRSPNNGGSQLTICFYQMRLLVVGLGCIQLNYWLRGPIEISEQPRLLLSQRVALYKWTVGTH